ncbi:VOC family protein [Amycolatopsis echigonensis]|uniref:VOC family protein n=1 Tax=Amycolatopsis echigonensis TaxID=2576905 RepID=A0A8E1W584_9PSEU|nr:VOC family protein [Amycolatopsis echigonensis]MBB2504400.1 VOC family protein [Amycolatopsis echigonensis]
MPARVPALYHPTIAVGDLDAARDWFRRVFARRPLRWEETLDLDLLEPDYPVNYSFFAFVADTHWVFLCPSLHARGALAGQTRYRNVPDGMIGLGWYTDDAVELFHRLAAAGIRAHDQQGRLITDAEPPRSSFAADVLTGFTEPADTGIRYEFQQTGKRHWAKYGQEADPRLRADWAGPVLDPADPLGLRYTSHHTVVTRDPARMLRLYTELLEGEVVGEGENAELGAASTFVRLGDTVLEIAVPTQPGPETANGADHYRGVTYVVGDCAQVRAHLAAVGVSTEDRPDATVIPPKHGFGAEWRFVQEPPYPEEARRPARLG